jgi:hypothetical protein
MPSPMKLARLATLPQTRRLVAAAGRSTSLRELGRRARTDRAGLARELRDPAITIGLVREAIRHPATRELADVGLLLLPTRYMPIGWAAAWLSRRLLRRDRRHVRPAPKPVSVQWS